MVLWALAFCILLPAVGITARLPVSSLFNPDHYGPSLRGLADISRRSILALSNLERCIEELGSEQANLKSTDATRADDPTDWTNALRSLLEDFDTTVGELTFQDPPFGTNWISPTGTPLSAAGLTAKNMYFCKMERSGLHRGIKQGALISGSFRMGYTTVLS